MNTPQNPKDPKYTRFATIFPKIDAWDKLQVNKIYHAATGRWTEKWALYTSLIGDPRLWGIALIALGIHGLIIQDLTLLVVFGTGFLQSFIVYYLIKKFFKRLRPFLQMENILRRDKTGHGYSFPSGHCQHSTILVSLLVLQFFPTPWIIPLLILYNISVGLSRIISGVHFPSDTIVGTVEAYIFVLFHWYLTRFLYLALFNWGIGLFFP